LFTHSAFQGKCNIPNQFTYQIVNHDVIYQILIYIISVCDLKILSYENVLFGKQYKLSYTRMLIFVVFLHRLDYLNTYFAFSRVVSALLTCYKVGGRCECDFMAVIEKHVPQYDWINFISGIIVFTQDSSESVGIIHFLVKIIFLNLTCFKYSGKELKASVSQWQ
jgi:hypothetical protein